MKNVMEGDVFWVLFQKHEFFTCDENKEMRIRVVVRQGIELEQSSGPATHAS
jgi:hypothetical protein